MPEALVITPKIFFRRFAFIGMGLARHCSLCGPSQTHTLYCMDAQYCINNHCLSVQYCINVQGEGILQHYDAGVLPRHKKEQNWKTLLLDLLVIYQ